MLSTMFTRLVHASTGAAFGSRTPAGLTLPSTCVFIVRQPDGQNVYRRVLVAIMVRVAFGTRPLTHVERHRFAYVAAGATSLARWKPAVYPNQCLAVPFALVFDLPTERAETDIAERFGKVVVLNHAGNIQVFDADHVKSAHKVGCHLMQVVQSRIADLRLNPCDTQASFLAAIAAFLLTSQGTLSTRQLASELIRMLRVGDTLAGAESHESIDTKIDTDRCARFGERLDRLVQHERHEIPAAAIFGNSHSRRLALESSRPVNIKTPDFGDGEVAIISIPLESGICVVRRLISKLPLILRVLSPLIEEVAERGLQMTQRLLQWNGGNLIEPRVIFALFKRRQRGTAFVVAALLSGAVGIRPKAQSPVVNIPYRPEDTRKLMGLVVCRIEAESVPQLHDIGYIICLQRRQYICKIFVDVGLVQRRPLGACAVRFARRPRSEDRGFTLKGS